MQCDAQPHPDAAVQSDRIGCDPMQSPLDVPIVVRPFKPGDAAAVRALFIKVNSLMAPSHLAHRFETYIAAALREEIDDIARYYAAHGGQFFVATATGNLVAMFGLEQAEPGVAELRRMYVDPQIRRCGIGRGLLASAVIEARSIGCTRMILSTSELQLAALVLYRNAGYREIRQEVAMTATNKSLGGAILRFHFEKALHPRP